ncbi:Receptor protein kinase TMK1 [Camellia lanceoleosa]|uniref:Receptor protein kinase TMK1 n=1 Tax=Camellia lanceoleosa TaxID=1840588 RepID=A0ACC0G219_9ERIC|nr:Receptor protein kinase TMK1 [Camellia lanceoleosa]
MGIITHLGSRFFALLFLSLLSIFVLVHTKSSSLDAAVMLILRQNLNASKSLGWIDPDPCQWQHVSCSEDGRVTRLQIGYQNLTGCLPSNLSYLTALQILDLSSNQLQGPLPSLAGLSSLQNLSLSNNNFSSIPFDFFFGMTSLERVYLDNNPFDRAPIPISLQSASNLKVFSANASNFSSKIPYFFGTFARLTTLHLAFNNLHGVLPATFSSSSIQSLWLNKQQSTYKLHGSIDVIQNMTQLKEVWLDSNSFSGPMSDFSRLMGLESFRVRDNSITGQVPASILDLPWLKVVSLTNNLLQGPTPKFNSSVTIDMETGSNSFCLPVHGAACNPRVNTLLSIAQFSGYPVVFSENWKGNDPCNGWFGLHCENENITVINFSNLGLTDGKSSILTKLAGTFGYLAPEYAVTGRVTTKIDVFSFGVILLQLITGRKAVVELETEHDEYVGLVAWFYKMRMQKDAFHKAIDSTINLDEETLASIDTVAELAGHCCANYHSQRPDMGHIVNVLSTLVDHWRPSNSHCDEGFSSFGEVRTKDYSHIF